MISIAGYMSILLTDLTCIRPFLWSYSFTPNHVYGVPVLTNLRLGKAKHIKALFMLLAFFSLDLYPHFSQATPYIADLL